MVVDDCCVDVVRFVGGGDCGGFVVGDVVIIGCGVSGGTITKAVIEVVVEVDTVDDVLLAHWCVFLRLRVLCFA